MSARPLTGAEAIAAVGTAAATVTDVAAGCLEKVRELDAAIGAFRVIDAGTVLSWAAELDGKIAGPLRGLVVGVKDVIDTVDLPTGYGSPLFANHRPAADADVVAALRRAGALVLGKTESTEFALFQPARTRNPVDPARTPGGSSSGSAAAVAAGMVPAALGTQTAGSVVRPAAYCGVYGFKPSQGWASTAGIWRLSRQLDTVGLFARCAGDLTLLYHALRGPAARTPGGGRPAPPRPARAAPAVAVLAAQEWATCDPEVHDALRCTADGFSDAGWQVRDLPMPARWRHLPEQHDVVMSVEVAKNLRAGLGDRLGQISQSARSVVERGDRCSAGEYLAALGAREQARSLLARSAVAADLVLAPSALGVAPEGLGFTGDPVMCRPWTLLGLPAANVPAYRRADGLPVGVQLVGLAGDDLGFLAELALAEAVLTPKEDANHPSDHAPPGGFFRPA